MRYLIMLLFLTGCTTNGVYDGPKTWTLVGGVLVAGAIVANDADSGGGSNCHWVVGANGSTQVCR